MFGKKPQTSKATGSKSRSKQTILGLGMAAFLSLGGKVGMDKTLENEGMKLIPYYDSGLILTWCGGETDPAYYKEKFTEAECRSLFAKRYGYFSYRVAFMYDADARATITPPVHAANVDTAYNIGLGQFSRSSMLVQANLGNPKGDCDAILLYKRANGRDCSLPANKRHCGGIWTRRKDMHKLCYTGLN